MPLAQIALRARNSKSGEAILQNAVRCLGEAGAALAAAFWLGRARERPSGLPDAVREKLAGLLDRGASFGGWVGLLREAVVAVGEDALARLLRRPDDLQPITDLSAVLEPVLRDDGPFQTDAAALRAKLAEARGGGVLQFLEFLVAFRNRVWGHGSVLPENVCLQLGPPFLEATAHVLLQEPLFDGHWLGRTGVWVLGGKTGHHWKRLMGTEGEFLPPDEPGLPPAETTDPRVLHFVKGTAAVSASFLVAQEEDLTGLWRFGFLSRIVGRRGPPDTVRTVQYLDYIGGRFQSDAAAHEAAEVVRSLGMAEVAVGATAPSVAPGEEERRFGDFVVEGELGQGMMGVVYRARQVSLDRTVALKVLPPALVNDPVAMGRFHRETAVLARCDHPNIVRILAYGVQEGRPWYAMEFVEGADLAQVYAVLRERKGKEGRLSARDLSEAASRGGRAVAAEPATGCGPEIAEAPGGPTVGREGSIYQAWARLFAQAADGLAEIHRRGVVHRDVKPANLMLNARGDRLVVMDLGLAKTAEQSRALTQRAGDAFVGSARYAAPEQIQARLVPMDHRADIYGLGMTLYEMVTLSPAYDCATVEELLEEKLVRQRDPAPPRERERRVPEDLDVIVRKATAREPGERYDTAEKLADDLRAFAEGRPISAQPPSRTYYLRMFYRRNRRLVGTAAAALLAVAATIVWAFVAVGAERDEAVAQRNRALQAEQSAERDRARAEDLTQFMLFDLRDRLQAVGRLELLESVARKALDYYMTVPKEHESPQARRKLAVALGNVGSVLQAQGDLPGALAAFRKALEIGERLAAADPSNTQWQRDLSVSHEMIGRVLQAQGDLPGALAAFRKTLEIIERLAAADPTNALWAADLAESCLDVAVVLTDMGGPADAPSALVERALNLLRPLRERGALSAEHGKLLSRGEALLAELRAAGANTVPALVIEATVTASAGHEHVQAGSACRFLVARRSGGPEGERCQAQVVCARWCIYGGASGGFLPCRFRSSPAANVAGKDTETTSVDGDGGLEIDTQQGVLRVWDDASGAAGEFRIEARITGVQAWHSE